MATKPTRKRPAKKSTATSTSTPTDAAATTETAAAKPKRQYNRKTPTASKLAVYYEDPEGTLQPMGQFKTTGKPDEAVRSYLEALDPEEFVGAIEAGTYAVDTPKGLQRFNAGQTIEITPR